MKKNLIAILGITAFVLFISNSMNVYSQKSAASESKEKKCTKEQMKEHNCSKEMKETSDKTEKGAAKCTVDESGNLKVPTIGKFHTHIAQLWHKDFPALNLKKMKKDTESMLKMFTKLEDAKLPKDYVNKEAEYKKAVSEFKTSLSDLNSYLATIKTATKDDNLLSQKVEKLHNDFHSLSGMFN